MSRTRLSRLRRDLTVACTLLVPIAAAASEEAHAHGGESALTPLLFSTINLAIFVAVLGRYVYPPVRDWVRERRTRVLQALHDAAAAKAEAETLRAQWEARLADVERAVEEMRTQAQQDAERERQRILEAAHRRAEAIRKDAERAAAYEVRRTQQQLRAELVRQAVRMAEEAARAQWSAADQQRFVAEFLKQVG